MGAKLTGSARTLTEPTASGATVGAGGGGAALVTGVAPGGKGTSASNEVARALLSHAGAGAIADAIANHVVARTIPIGARITWSWTVPRSASADRTRSVR